MDTHSDTPADRDGGTGASLAIRPLETADIAQVMVIEAASFSSPWPRSAFDLALCAPSLLSLVAMRSDELVGYLIACPYETSVLIANVAVQSQARRCGVGRTLVEWAVAWSAERGATRCRLEVRTTNVAAIELYRKLGFQPVAIQPAYYNQPTEDALTMVCPLAATGETSPESDAASQLLSTIPQNRAR